ncbi:MAG TPA: aminotransferase class V-fold PLP-dependent enzyme [Kofleriaceae bacterium]
MRLEVPALTLDRWALTPEVVHLNHGSYGGCPASVIDAAIAMKRRLEGAPMRFFGTEWQALVDRARADLARFLNAPAHRLVFTPNATSGVAIALASCELAAGDEILATDHTYRACKNQLERLARERAARLVIVPITLPFDPDAAVDAITRAVTTRTKIALFDHITSPTAVIMPLDRIIPRLPGVQVIIDGAHAPGQIELDVSALSTLGLTYYAGNNHKWLCAPKSTGFLFAGGPAKPLVTSHGASPDYGPANRLHAELDWPGTYDPTAQLAVTDAIAALAAVGTIADIADRNHRLALALRDHVIDAMDGRRLAPDSSLAAMAAIPIVLPPNVTPHQLTQRLLRDNWELPIVDWPGQPLVRICAHLYNSLADGPPLVAKLRELGVSLSR